MRKSSVLSSFQFKKLAVIQSLISETQRLKLETEKWASDGLNDKYTCNIICVEVTIKFVNFKLASLFEKLSVKEGV